jgi:hypothetical protein
MIVIILIFVLILFFINNLRRETFDQFPSCNGYTCFPFWNTAFGSTRNMSYDIRGDPAIIPKTNFVWNNGTIFPIHNKRL